MRRDHQLDARVRHLRQVIKVWEAEKLVAGAWLPTETLAVLDALEAEAERVRIAHHDVQLAYEGAVQACEDLQGELAVLRAEGNGEPSPRKAKR